MLRKFLQQKTSLGEELEKLKALVTANEDQKASEASRVAELEAINSGYNSTVKTLQTQLEQFKAQLIVAEASAQSMIPRARVGI